MMNLQTMFLREKSFEGFTIKINLSRFYRRLFSLLFAFWPIANQLLND